MFDINRKIEEIKVLYHTVQTTSGTLPKARVLMAMAFLACAINTPAASGAISGHKATGDTVAPAVTVSAEQPAHRTNPNELVLYYHAINGGNITPQSSFSVCTISEGGDPHKFTGINYGKDGRIGLLNQAKNPKFPLSWFSMKKWQQICAASQSGISDDVVLCISNQGATPLYVTLPTLITMRLFLFGKNVIIKNDARIENGCPIIGVDPRRMEALSSGCPFYTDHIVPSTIRIKGHLHGNPPLVIRSRVVLEKGLPKSWRLLNASVTVLDGSQEHNDGHPFGIECYGRTNVVFAKTARINGDVMLGSDDEPLRTDPSDRANNGVACFSNVIFAPKTLTMALPFDKHGGCVTIKGQVDLSHTTIRIVDRNTDRPMTKDTRIGRSTTIIESDRPIMGTPKIECGPHWQIKCKVVGNKLFVIGHKGLSASSQPFPKGYS